MTAPRQLTPDEAARAEVREMVANVISMRKEWIQGMSGDRRRDVARECGWPDAVEATTYRAMFDRDPLANRVVRVMPQQCFQVTPLVYEDDSAEVSTDFEKAWDELADGLKGGKSWHGDETGSALWAELYRLDVVSGIGRFGVLLLGVDDGKALWEPLDGVADSPQYATPNGRDKAGQVGKEPTPAGGAPLQDNPKGGQPKTFQQPPPGGDPYAPKGQGGGNEAQYWDVGSFGTPGGTEAGEPFGQKPSKQKRRLLFLRSFDESLVQITQFEPDLYSPRFGQPVMYRVTLHDPRTALAGIGLPQSTVNVHWSRVIHVADNTVNSPIAGAPRQEPVWNTLMDARKVRGAAAEGFYRSAFPGLSLETHPALGGDVEVDDAKLKDALEQYFNGLDRALRLTGMTAKTLAPNTTDPTPYLETLVEAVCVQLQMPVRVFKGSERGELASSQDDSQWNDVVRARQHLHVTPNIVAPFIDRLIMCGVLPEPKYKPPVSKKPSGPLMLTQRTAAATPPLPGAKPPVGGAPKPGGPPALPPAGTPKPGAPGKPPTPPTANAFPPPKAPANGTPKPEYQDPKAKDDGKGATGPSGQGLPSPQGEDGDTQEDYTPCYHVEWPDLDSLGKAQKAAILLQKTQAYAAYVSGGIENAVPLREYMTKFDDFEEETADAILAGAEEAQTMKEDQDAQKAQAAADQASALADEHGFKPTPPPGFVDPEMVPKPVPGMPPGGKGKGPPKPPTGNEATDPLYLFPADLG